MKDPFKTQKMHTVPIPVVPAFPAGPPSPPVAEEPTPAPAPSSPAQSGRPSVIPHSPPPSSDASWTSGEAAPDRATDPVMSVVPSAGAKDRATLTIIAGINAGQVFALDGTEHVLGRGTEADLWLEDGGVSRRHARVTCRSDGRYFVQDLGSTNGTFLGTQRIDLVEIKPGDRVQLGPHVILRFAITDDAEDELQRRLFESSTRDGLTRLYNRKYFTERLTAEVAYSRRHKVKLSVIMVDIDDFKGMNDTYGHLVGDMVLRLVSAQMLRLIRVEDLLARFGGEEFVILARSTSKTEAAMLADRIRESIEQLEMPVDGHSLRVTLSLGVAALPDVPEGGPNEIIALADARLYQAKSDGKNRVCSEGTI